MATLFPAPNAASDHPIRSVIARLTQRAKAIPPAYLSGPACRFALTTPDGSLVVAVRDGALTVSPGAAHVDGLDFEADLAMPDLEALLASSIDVLTLANTERLRIRHRDRDDQLRRLQYYWTSLQARWYLTDDVVGRIERRRPGYLISAVERIDAGDEDGFRGFAAAGTPVVLTGAADRWPIRRHPLDGIVARFGDVPVSLLVREHSSTAADGAAQYRASTLGAYLDDIRTKDPGDRDFPYLAANAIPPALANLIAPPPYFPSDAFANTRMWIGPRSTGLNCHRDLVDNFLAQVFGLKRLVLFSPDQARYLYPRKLGGNPFYQPSLVELDAIDLALTPDFAHARRVECVLEEGDMIFLPAGWWHQVYNLELAWSFNFFAVNQPPRALVSGDQP